MNLVRGAIPKPIAFGLFSIAVLFAGSLAKADAFISRQQVGSSQSLQQKIAPLRSIRFGEIGMGRIVLSPGQQGILVESLKAGASATSFVNTDRRKDAVSRGGDMSGGGSTLTVGGRKVFLDLFARGEVADGGSCLSENFKPVGTLYQLELEKTCLHQDIVAAFSRTADFSPTLHRALLSTYRSLPFYLMKGTFRILDMNFYLDPSIDFGEGAVIQTTALYVRDVGVLVAGPNLFELSRRHQVALFVHEILRALQIQFSVTLTNAEIQRIVFALLYSDQAELVSVLKSSGLSDFSNVRSTQTSYLLQAMDLFHRMEAIRGQILESELERMLSLARKPGGVSSFQLADILAAASGKLLVYRVQSKSFLPETIAADIEAIEMKLDGLIAGLRADGTQGIYFDALGEVAEITGLAIAGSGRQGAECLMSPNPRGNCKRLVGDFQVLVNGHSK